MYIDIYWLNKQKHSKVRLNYKWFYFYRNFFLQNIEHFTNYNYIISSMLSIYSNWTETKKTEIELKKNIKTDDELPIRSFSPGMGVNFKSIWCTYHVHPIERVSMLNIKIPLQRLHQRSLLARLTFTLCFTNINFFSVKFGSILYRYTFT